MMVKNTAMAILGGMVFLGSFLVTVLLWYGRPNSVREVLVFYPDQRTGEVFPERRGIPSGRETATAARSLLQTMIAGPQDLTLGRVLPVGTKIKGVFFRDGQLVVSFDQSFQGVDSLSILGPKDRLEFVKMSISYNFPEVSKFIPIIDNAEVR